MGKYFFKSNKCKIFHFANLSLKNKIIIGNKNKNQNEIVHDNDCYDELKQ